MVIKEERYYFGDYEIYRKFVNSTLDTERTTINVSDDKKKITQIEKQTVTESSLTPDASLVVRYQYDNHLGSASLELDESTEIISYEEYHPFGTTSYRSGRTETETSQKRYKYVGKERDEETGLYYYGARYYAAWICRFVSVDPLQFDYPQLTPFNYAGNKPITHIDIDGMQSTGDEKIPPVTYEDVQPTYDEEGNLAKIEGVKVSVAKNSDNTYTLDYQNTTLKVVDGNEHIVNDVHSETVTSEDLLTDKGKEILERYSEELMKASALNKNNSIEFTPSNSDLIEGGSIEDVQSGGDDHLGRYNNAFSLAGLAWGINETAIYNKYFWLGKNLKYNSTAWTTGNQWTGTSLQALKIAKPAKILGRFAFYANAAYSIYGVGKGINTGDYSGALFSGLGGVYSGIATYGGLLGLVIAGPLVLIDATIGLDNFMQIQVDFGIQRGNEISNGNYSNWASPRFGQSVH